MLPHKMELPSLPNQLSLPESERIYCNRCKTLLAEIRLVKPGDPPNIGECICQNCHHPANSLS